jgi:hypothetical protein
MTVLRNTELKADRFLDASTLGQLIAGQTVDSIKMLAGCKSKRLTSVAVRA